MFFKVISSKDGDVLVGNFVISTGGKSSKAIRCMSITMQQINSLINKTIIDGSETFDKKDLFSLDFKAEPTKRSILPILALGQTHHGWVPSIEVLFALEHEYIQFINHLEQMMSEVKLHITSKPEFLNKDIISDLQLVVENREMIPDPLMKAIVENLS